MLTVILDTYMVTAAFPYYVLAFLSLCVAFAGELVAVSPWSSRLRKATNEGKDPYDLEPDTGPHTDRGDGYCAHCYQPWPCSSGRG